MGVLPNRLISYSNLSSYEQCPYQWYLNYLECRDGESNFYADNGSIVHEILEQIANGVISIDDAAMEYLNRSDELSYFRINQDTKDKVIGSCIDFFTEYDFNLFNDYEIVGTEMEVFFEIGGYKFRGFIDLLLKDNNGNYLIFDYKSSAYPLRKDGQIKKASEKTVEGYVKQAYLYALGIKSRFSVYPSSLNWLFFKDQKIMTVEFSEETLKSVEGWALSLLEKIENDEEFLPTNNADNYFMCHQLCNFRNSCEYVNDEYEE